jgi:hypothetical protein
MVGIEPRPFARHNSGGTRAASPGFTKQFLYEGVEELPRGTALSRANGRHPGSSSDESYTPSMILLLALAELSRDKEANTLA